MPLGDLQRMAWWLVASCRHLHLGASTLQLCTLGCDDICHVTLIPVHTCMPEEEGVSRQRTDLCGRISEWMGYLMDLEKLMDSSARRC